MTDLPVQVEILESVEDDRFVIKVTWTDTCNCRRQALFPSGATRSEAELASAMLKVLVQDTYNTGHADASNPAFFTP